MTLYPLIICGPICNANAPRLYTAIYQALSRDPDSVTVDFAGTTGVTADFLATAFGALLDHFPRKELDSRLSILELDPIGLELYRIIMSHANQYLNNNIYRDIIDLIQQRRPPTEPEAEAPAETGPTKPPRSPYVQVPTKVIET